MPYSRHLGSVNEDFKLGSIDGSYKQAVKDRGGVVETATYDARKDVAAAYGINECPDKELPAAGGKFKYPYEPTTPSPGIKVTDQRI